MDYVYIIFSLWTSNIILNVKGFCQKINNVGDGLVVQNCQSCWGPFDSEELMKMTEVFKKIIKNKPENITPLYKSIV